MPKIRKNYRIKEEVSKVIDTLVAWEKRKDPKVNETVVVERAIAFYYLAVKRRSDNPID